MEQNYSSTKLPTAASTVATGHTTPTSVWQDVNNILSDDSTSATWGAYLAGQGASITGATFNLPKQPDNAVIDGIQVYVEGSQTGCYGNVTINPAGTTGKAIGALNGSFGGPDDLWGATSIAPSAIA